MTGTLLLTGAGGFIGRRLAPRLRSAGWRVVTTSRGADADEPHVDLADREAVADLMRRREPSSIVHLAGATRGGLHELVARNVATTENVLLAASRQTSLDSVVILGSAAELGAGPRLGDDAPPHPVSDYGLAKARQVALAVGMARTHGLPLTVLRPFNLVEPALPAWTALGGLKRQLLSAATREPQVRCGRLDVVRDYVPLELLLEAIVRALRRPLPGSCLNVCSGLGIALSAVLAAMASRFELRPRIEVDAELASLPTAMTVVGDPTLLATTLGLSVRPTADSVARWMLDAEASG